jgi:hypothetical protein
MFYSSLEKTDFFIKQQILSILLYSGPFFPKRLGMVSAAGDTVFSRLSDNNFVIPSIRKNTKRICSVLVFDKRCR